MNFIVYKICIPVLTGSCTTKLFLNLKPVKITLALVLSIDYMNSGQSQRVHLAPRYLTKASTHQRQTVISSLYVPKVPAQLAGVCGD